MRNQPPSYDRSVATLATSFDAADHEALHRCAMAGAATGRLGGVRRASGSSSEHLPPLQAEDFDAADDTVSGVWLAIREAHAQGARWRLPGRVHRVQLDPSAPGVASDVRAFTRALSRGRTVEQAQRSAMRIVDSETGEARTVTAQQVRSPYHRARNEAKNLGQRRRIHRIRMRDGLSPMATDHRLPDIDAGLDAAELVARCLPRLRDAMARALARYRSPARAVNGNAKRDLERATIACGERTAKAIIRTLDKGISLDTAARA